MPRSDQRSLPGRLPRAEKRNAGTTRVSKTALDVRVGGVTIDDELKERIPAQLGRRMERYAKNVTRVAVRFKDINGPRGGVDTVCRIAMSVKGQDDLVVEARAADPTVAFNEASKLARTALARTMERKGPERRRQLVPRAQPAKTRRRKAAAGVAVGSLIGRRVGRAKKNLMDAWELSPGNVNLRPRKATATLEDSAKARPSRKSTRKSANRAKSGSKLARKAKAKQATPRARASRARAR